jgi:hypothetical protein
MGMEDREGEQRGQRESTPKENEERGRRPVEIYDQRWQRDDRAEWTEELSRAHVAFEIGREWGMQWAMCVEKFFNFEAAWGFVKGSWHMSRKDRPQQVTGWLARGRRWTMPPTLGGLLGRRAAKGQAEMLWVGLWWAWWRSLQPKERAVLENGELSRPENADWSTMAKMYGDNGLLQVMAGLVWWGEVVQKRDEDEKDEWRAAVSDVTWVLERVLESGEIRR